VIKRERSKIRSEIRKKSVRGQQHNIEVLSAITYYLDLPLSWQIHNIFHASLLSLYCETGEHRTNYSRPTPKLVSGEPEWRVEQILAS